ncbi:fusion glycoprotein [Menangle virus]|uniref:Fusion glycoprotein F0 n=1 Tax=Menangle virus TaxID=152219 RepID=K9MY70_9MONO|nr:fusion glycoprotein [Menangle virus]AFY09792.1 fusion glycoprotein [Menangle virus]
MIPRVLGIIVLYLTHSQILCINRNTLYQIGLIHRSVKKVNFYSQGSPSYIVVKLVPTLAAIPPNCSIKSLQRYKETVTSLVQPISDNLGYLQDKLVTGQSRRRRRFAGVAIGLAALGVAAAAQATAAVALVETRENAGKIQALSESIQNTNQAVHSLKTALGFSATAIQAIQNQVNEVINPAINKLSCEVLDSQLASMLNLYLIHLTTVFQTQLTNPALTPLSIQALTSVLQGTSGVLMNSTNSTLTQPMDLLATGLITGQIISVNMTSLQLIIATFMPSIAELPNAVLHSFFRITTSVNLTEVMIQSPEFIMEQNGVFYDFNTAHCQLGDNNVYCPYIDAARLSSTMTNCINGKLGDCVFSRVIGSFPSRFVSLNGAILANCKFMRCNCLAPEKIITPLDGEMISLIDLRVCQKLTLGTITFEISQPVNVSFQGGFVANAGQIIVTNPFDISAELGQINNSLNDAQGFLDQSNNWLKVSGWISNSGSLFIAGIVVIGLIVLCIVIIIYINVQIIREVNRLRSFIYRDYVLDHDKAPYSPELSSPHRKSLKTVS